MWTELLAVLGALWLASLAWDAISSWIEQNRTPSTRYAELIRERLANGRYRVVGGVFTASGKCQARQAWEVDELDDDTRRVFGSRDRVRVKV